MSSLQNRPHFYITTPIYYVNATPHLGHAYTSIFCDVIKRFHEMKGDKTYFLTGTDEHGDKIVRAAAEKGITPQELVDQNSSTFLHLLKKINVSNNSFVRTTSTSHKEYVSQILQKVYDNGDIYFKEFSGKYCYGCERYYGDDELVEGLCPDHKVAPTMISEQNYFFRMSKYWEKLKEYVKNNEHFIVPHNYRNEVLGLLNEEPLDLCISRPKARLTWGVELPFDKNYVTYVWFDALLNYLSGMKEHSTAEEFEQFWANVHHVMAKDILKPHCVYWTTMLMSMGFSLPKQIAIHGYWLTDAQKMSKSLGNVVVPEDYCNKYGEDLFRYFLMRGMSFGKDAGFSHDQFIETCNAELANNLGNLLSRVVAMCSKNFEGKIPGSEKKNETELERTIEKDGLALKGKIERELLDWQTAKYLEHVVEYANTINRYLQETKPWILAKDESNPEAKANLATILKTALEGIRICFSWLTPVIPNKAETVLKLLGVDTSSNNKIYESATSWGLLNQGFILPEKVAIFPRLDD